MSTKPVKAKAPSSADKKTKNAAAQTSKGSLHPDFGVVKVCMTDGSSFEVRSTLARKQNVINLEVDRHNHPAWNKNHANNLHGRASKVKDFNEKYKLDF